MGKNLFRNDWIRDEVVSVDVVHAPRHGMVTIDLNGRATYTAGETYDGRDYFRYKVTTRSGDEDTACVKVRILS